MRFILGHHTPKADATSKFTGHYRAQQVVKTMTVCGLASIGGCRGPLQRAHLDQDPLNNDPANIKVLCQSHHFLYDRGRIDLAHPVMPPYYEDAHGNRRYEHVLRKQAAKPRPYKSTAKYTPEQRRELRSRAAKQMHADGRLGPPPRNRK